MSTKPMTAVPTMHATVKTARNGLRRPTRSLIAPRTGETAALMRTETLSAAVNQNVPRPLAEEADRPQAHREADDREAEDRVREVVQRPRQRLERAARACRSPPRPAPPGRRARRAVSRHLRSARGRTSSFRRIMGDVGEFVSARSRPGSTEGDEGDHRALTRSGSKRSPVSAWCAMTPSRSIAVARLSSSTSDFRRRPRRARRPRAGTCAAKRADLVAAPPQRCHAAPACTSASAQPVVTIAPQRSASRLSTKWPTRCASRSLGSSIVPSPPRARRAAPASRPRTWRGTALPCCRSTDTGARR